MAKKKSPSWGVILLCIIFFFPIMIIWLIQKVTTEKDRYIPNGKLLKTISYVMALLPVFVYFYWMNGKWLHDDGTPATLTDFSVLTSSFLFIAVFLFCKGVQFIARGQAYDRHLAQFSQDNPIDIRQLSLDVKLPYKTTCSDLQYMIKSGYISNAYVDERLGSLIYREDEEEIPEETEMQVFVCPNCCGKNMARSGSAVKCSYCDSTFEIE